MKEQRTIRGVVASGGIAIGRAIRAFDPLLFPLESHIDASEKEQEVSRFRASVEKCRKQLDRMRSSLRLSSIPESSFLVDAHLLILQDPLFVDRIVQKIERDAVNAEWAIQQVSAELYGAYDRLQDEYLRERRGDLEDIVRRLLHNLRSKAHPSPVAPPAHDAILVGKTIPPSVLFELRASRVTGLVTELGSPLSHTAIVARSLGLPAVMGVEDLSSISSGDMLIVDGRLGTVICDPDSSTLKEYRQKTKASRVALRRSASGLRCSTQDGLRISLGANINFPEEAEAAANAAAEFIGLYRTEFDFFKDGHKPREEDLVERYSHVVKTMHPAPVTFRTIDVGSGWLTQEDGASGLASRGLRFSLENQDVFKLQLRALFRASQEGPLHILLPLVSTIDDLDAALDIIAGVKRDLTRHRQPFDRTIPIGVMIETPAAAQTCDLMASRVDFFCLGTNDLIQYCLVVDRSDQSAARLYTPFHPAILRCLHQVYTLLQYSGRPVTVCGEMAADPAAAAVLIGLGFTSLSVSLAAYPRMRETVATLNSGKLRELTGEIMKMDSPRNIEKRVRSAIA